MVRKTWHDLETYSPTPLAYGTHRYAEEAEVMIWAYADADGPVHVWDVTRGEGMPKSLYDILRDPEAELWWQNGGMFDRTVLARAAPQTYAMMHPERWRDTMVQAYAHGLPGSLDKLCEVFRLPVDLAKKKEGSKYIQLFCKPQAVNRKVRRATRDTHPEEWKGFLEYAAHDILAMRELHRLMPKWNYPNNTDELKLWFLDQRQNMRGIHMDLDLANAAIRAVDKAQIQLAERTQDLTEGDVKRASQRDKLLAHLLSRYGVALPDMQKATLERRINDENLPSTLRQLLAIRLETTTSSTAKYKTLIRGLSSDGRLRGLTQFCGAARTGRDAHRLFQPGNLPRLNVELIKNESGLTGWPDKDDKKRYIETGVEAIKQDQADTVFSNVMGLASNLIRSVIIAPPKKKLVVSDLSNIEGRVAAWLAHENWKLEAFRQYDAKIGPDLYILAYSRSFNVPVDRVNDEQRQLGKVQELALQYEGGVGAFVTMAITYKMDLEAIAAAVELSRIDSTLVAEARSAWKWAVSQNRTLGLPEHVYIACDILKRAWRRAHPAIASYWLELKQAAIEAIRAPGVSFKARRLSLRRDGEWLRLKLPSGRFLCYLGPRVDEKGQISYMGVDPYSKKWKRLKTYGGKFLENASQGGARDVFFHHLPQIEEAGYSPVLRVHDEGVMETEDEPRFNAEHLSQLMSTPLPWALDLPLASAGFEDVRYRKG